MNSTNRTLKVAITGAAGRIAYSLLPLLCSGSIFGEAKIDLRLIDIEVAQNTLHGVTLELQDCNYTHLINVVATCDPSVGFKDVDVAILLGGFPRKQGMERKELIAKNAEGIVKQAHALENYASRNVKVLVVANPANTNCLAAMEAAPKIPKQNFSCLTRLDHERLRAILTSQVNAIRAKNNESLVRPENIHNVVIWGNHSSTQVPSIDAATVAFEDGTTHPVRDYVDGAALLPVIDHVQRRGAAIINALGASSGMSAANSIAKHLCSWLGPVDAENEIFSMGIASDGNPYCSSLNICPGLVVSFPCRRVPGGVPGEVEIVRDIPLDDMLRPHLDSTIAELKMEARDLRSATENSTTVFECKL
jgi:malate dehydrogenase